MSGSVLYPPHAKQFGDGPIRKVMLRVRPFYYACATKSSIYADPFVHDSGGESTSEDRPGPISATEVTSISPAPTKKKATMAPHKDKKLSRRKRKPNEELEIPETVNDKVSNKSSDATESWIELRRRRRRDNMQRYRNKLRNKEVTLDADVEELQQDIQALQLHRQTLLAGATESSVWHAVAEFFRLFQCGLKEPQAATELCTAQEDSISRGYHAQRGFVYATMSPDVIGLTGCGIEELLEDFHAIARCIPNMSTKTVRLKNGARNSMIAITEVEVTFTVNTLRLALPHLIRDGKWSSLATKLLGQRLVTQGSTHFEWDAKTSRVSLLRSTADLLAPMLQLLGDLEIVSGVFNNALITPELVPVPSEQSSSLAV